MLIRCGCLLLMLFSALPAAAQSGAPTEYQGLEFGSALIDAQGLTSVASTMTKNKDAYKGVYFREDEDLTFGQASLRSVAYYYLDDRLRSVRLVLEGDVNSFLVKDELIARYGQGRQIGNKYGWTWDEFSLVMERDPTGKLSVVTYTYEPRPTDAE